MANTTWTPQKSLTFSVRIYLTWSLFLVLLRQAATFTTLVWSSGATVSFRRTRQQNGNDGIEIRSGQRKSQLIVRAKR
jgi:hypothetical protein